MRIKIKHSAKENESILRLLDIALNDFSNYDDVYLGIIVRDAKLLASDYQMHLYSVDRRVIKFSAALSSFDKKELMSMDADNLHKEDYQQLYNFFKKKR